MFEALTSIPNASVSMGVRLHISRAGRKTSTPVSLSWHRNTLPRQTRYHRQNNTGQHRQRLPICRSYGDFGIHLPEAAQPGTFIDPAKRTADHKELPRLQRDEHPFECPLTLGMRQQLNKFGGPFSRPCRSGNETTYFFPPSGHQDGAGRPESQTGRPQSFRERHPGHTDWQHLRWGKISGS